jgi:holliday junction DNA helicase RuvA
VHTPAALRRALLDDDVDALVLVPGVGKRTAQRMLVDLKARLELPDVDLTEPEPGRGVAARVEVREALSSLGYGPDEVRAVVAQLSDDGSVEELLRDALKLLAVSRT